MCVISKIQNALFLYSNENASSDIFQHCYAPPCYGGGLMYWWPLSVHLSVCPMPDPNSRTEGHGKLKIGRTWHGRLMTPFRVERSNTWQGWGNFGFAQPVYFTGTLMSNRWLVYYDLQAESSGWLFKSPLTGGKPHCVSPSTGHTACRRWISKTFIVIKAVMSSDTKKLSVHNPSNCLAVNNKLLQFWKTYITW